MRSRVFLERADPVGLITLDSPETANSMDMELGSALESHMEKEHEFLRECGDRPEHRAMLEKLFEELS